jgi:hypothetical protein
MSLSPTSYYPFDSDAPSYFKATQISNCLDAAFLTLLLYDHVTTLDKEVQWIWTLQWRLPKIIFIVNRYFFTLLLLLITIPEFIFPLPISFCNFRQHLAIYLPFSLFSAAEILMLMRVSSLYGHRKLLTWSLGCFFGVAFVGSLVSQVLPSSAEQTILSYWSMPGCWSEDKNDGLIPQWPMWLSFLTVEVVLMLLTAYKLRSYCNEMSRTITVLARDSMAYFLVICACLAFILADDFDYVITFEVKIPAQCASSVAVGRMMMNLRGLVLDDPEHTVHLQTIQFAGRDRTGAEIDETAWV